jgi:tungstate transport system ATP-binding protein
MNSGEILQTGSSDEVMNRPVTEFVASLVGVENILKGKVIRKESGTFIASVSGQEIKATGDVGLGEQVSLCIRPENVILSAVASGNPSSAKDTFPGTVEKMTPIGLYKKVQLNCGFPLTAYVTNPSFSDLSLKEGTEVLAFFHTTAIHVIRK